MSFIQTVSHYRCSQPKLPQSGSMCQDLVVKSAGFLGCRWSVAVRYSKTLTAADLKSLGQLRNLDE